MVICHEKKFIHIDICKCDGTSINHALGKYFKCEGKHHSIRNFTGDDPFCSNLTMEMINEYFVFTFVRNPFDRIVSLWLWGQGQGRVYRKYSFKKFVKEVERTGREPGEGLFYEYNRHRYVPMLDWFADEKGVLEVNYIGRYEKLEEYFFVLCELLNINDSVKLPVKNKSRGERKHYREYYDDESRKIVERLYEKDLNFFKYEF